MRGQYAGVNMNTFVQCNFVQYTFAHYSLAIWIEKVPNLKLETLLFLCLADEYKNCMSFS